MIKKYFLAFSIMTIAITMILGLSSLSLQQNQFIINLSGQLQSSTHYFTVWRYSFFILLILNWKRMIVILNHSIQLNPNVVFYLINKRWHALGFIILFEILIARNGLALGIAAITPLLY